MNKVKEVAKRVLPEPVKAVMRKAIRFYRRKTFRPYIKHKHVEGAEFDFYIADLTGQVWYGEDREWKEMRFIRDRIARPGDIVFECGGHHGCTAILLSKWVQDKGKIITFEPIPANAEVIRKNIGLNNIRNVSVEQKAVGSSPGRIIIGASSGGIELGGVSDGIEVSAAILDNYKDLRPTFLKIDVEGYELEVLRGAEEILKTVPKLAVEIHPEKMRNYGASVKDLLRIIGLDRYDCWVQRDVNKMPERFRPEEEILAHTRFYAVPEGSSTNNT